MPITPIVCDIYHSNSVNFSKVKDAGILGVIHKATQGIGRANDDGRYGSRRETAEQLGLLWGAYSFSTDDDVATNVAHFFEVAAPSPTTRMCLDFEDLVRNAMSGAHALEFLDRCNQRLGRATTLYGGNRIREHVDPQSKGWVDMAAITPLWLCQYKSIRNVPDLAALNRYINVPAPWRSYDLLQYAADGAGPLPHQVPGLEDGADLNAYQGTPEQLGASWAGGALSPGQISHPVPAPPAHDAPPLDVRWLQAALNRRLAISLAVDGIYGHGTTEAVRRFQAVAGLEVDGMAGPKTIAALT